MTSSYSGHYLGHHSCSVTRRVHSLVRLGYPLPWVLSQVGLTPTQFRDLEESPTMVSWAVIERARRIHRRYSAISPALSIKQPWAEIKRWVNYAVDRQWSTVMAFNNIDNPTEKPTKLRQEYVTNADRRSYSC